MTERDKRLYDALKADPVRYAAYLETKRKQRKARQEARGYETLRKRRWRSNNPEVRERIRKAGHAVETALRNGKLVKPSACSECGRRRKVEAHHHHGYMPEHWLDVVWLCNPCHAKKHHE